MAKSDGAARERVLETAAELFAEHGVQGTSLQMIADRIGVGKAAVYYQFRSKDDIVRAILTPVFDDIAELVSSAESLLPQRLRREAAIEGLVGLAVRRRRASFPFRRDHHIDELIAGDPRFQSVFDRFHALLLGPDPDPAARIAVTMALAGVYHCATDPDLADIPAEQLNVLLRDLFSRCVAQNRPENQRAGAAKGQPTDASRDETWCSSSGLGSLAVII